ncbi:MAG TPA: porin [Methylococcus sp.]|nr:porin [Methylococcus sp.]
MFKRKILVLAVTTLGGLGSLAPLAAGAKTHDERVDLLEARIRELEAKLEKALAASAEKQAAAPAPDLKKIDQKVKLIERKLEVEKEASDAKWAKLPKNVELGTQGLKVVSQDENFILYMRALIQADGSYFMDDSQAGDATNPGGDSLADKFYMRRVRPILEGTVWKWFDYRIMPDFGSGQTRLFDAYADFRYFRQASMAAGKFKAPVSLERLQSATALPFIERAYPTQLAPNRDVGFMLHGEFDKPGYPTDFSKLDRNQTYGGNFPMYMYPDFFSYQVGIFDGSRNNGNIDSDTNDSKEYQARIFAHPFLHSGIESLEGLGLGIAGTWGQPNDDRLSNYQSPGLNNIFVYNNAARADGTQYRIYPQGYWIWGPFQLVGEYALSNLDVANQSIIGGHTVNKYETNQNDQAWNVTVSYMLTGEENVFLRQGIRPRHPFDPMYGIRPDRPFNPTEGHWGAFQVAARWTYIDFDDGIFENVGTASKPNYPFADPRNSVSAATTWALGLNWWLNPNVKLMVDYSQTSFDDGAGVFDKKGALTPVVASRETEKVWQTRIQLGF